jgi:hypothetical protein
MLNDYIYKKGGELKRKLVASGVPENIFPNASIILLSPLPEPALRTSPADQPVKK